MEAPDNHPSALLRPCHIIPIPLRYQRRLLGTELFRRLANFGGVHRFEDALNERPLGNGAGERKMFVYHRLWHAPKRVCLNQLRVFLYLYYVGNYVRGFSGHRVGDTAHGWTELSSRCDEHLDVHVFIDSG